MDKTEAYTLASISVKEIEEFKEMEIDFTEDDMQVIADWVLEACAESLDVAIGDAVDYILSGRPPKS